MIHLTALILCVTVDFWCFIGGNILTSDHLTPLLGPAAAVDAAADGEFC